MTFPLLVQTYRSKVGTLALEEVTQVPVSI